MSAEMLRQAAVLMREDYGPEADVEGHPEGDPTMLALADLLDEVARKWEVVSGGSRPVFDDEVAALAVATAYLGGAA